MEQGPNHTQKHSTLPPPEAGEAFVSHPRELYPDELVTKIVALGSLALKERSSQNQGYSHTEHEKFKEKLEISNPSRKEKKSVWEAQILGDTKKTINPTTGEKVKLPPQYAIKGVRDEMVAIKIGKKANHLASHNAEKSLLESGIYKIDPKTGLSRLNDKNGSAKHLSWSQRRRIKKAQNRYRKLSEH